MKLIGLTGGIASGKSTVSAFLRTLGAHVVDADAVYHTLIQPTPQGTPSPLASAVAQHFPNVLLPNGSLNRKTLGEAVFNNAQARALLESITHPAVAQTTAQLFQTLQNQGATHAVYDVPLLFERQLHTHMFATLVVWVPAHIQLQRLIKRDNLTQEEALKRIQSQMPLDQKKDLATWVIDNSSSLEHTRLQTHNLWNSITHPNP